MLEAELQHLGLSAEEARVYLAALCLGSGAVSSIAKQAGVQRVACYHTLENLLDQGLVSCVKRNRVKHFTAESPQRIVEQREAQLQQAKRILPELLSLSNALAYKPKIHYYEGIQGMKHILDDTLSSTNEILGYTNLAAISSLFSKQYLQKHAQSLLAQKIKLRMLSPTSSDSTRYVATYYPKEFDHHLLEVLFVNPEEFSFEYEIRIYNDKVALLSLNPVELIGLIMESPVFAATQRAIFNLSWLGACSFVAR